ncbi:hypothetical protein ABPG72_016469 [Tetrahymena utriculariae]
MQYQQTNEQICITHNNITNFFCLREGINIDHFENLLKVVFMIDGNILGLKSQKTGIIYDIGEFCNQNYFQLSNETFQLISSNVQLGSPLNSNPTRQSLNIRSYSNLSQSVPKQSKSNHKPSSRNKSNDIPPHIQQKLTHRYSIKSASKYSDEPCQFFIEDFEVFMTLPGKDNPEYLFCFFLFDDTQAMKQYGPLVCRSYSNNFPSVDFYYSLYPSKRSRSPFQPSDKIMLFSFYQGHNIIIERELALSYDASEEIIKAMNQYIQKHDLFHSKSDKRMSNNFNEDNTYTENSFQMINQLGSDSNFQRREGSFSDIPTNQDNVFDIIECFSKNQIRKHFTDDQFKDLLKLVRKNSKKINNIYEQFKVSNDYEELLSSLRSILNVPLLQSTNPHTQNGNFNILQSSNTNNILKCLKSDSNKVNNKQDSHKRVNSKSQKKAVPNEMSFDVSSKEKKLDLSTLKGLRIFLKTQNTVEKLGSNVLENREIGYLVYGLKQNDQELLELLHNLNTYTKQKVILTILKAYCSQQMQNILCAKFNSRQLDFIKESENEKDSPIQAAFLNWMVLGNLNDLILILEENVKLKKYPSILKNKKGKITIDEQAFGQLQKVVEQFDYSPSQIAREQQYVELNGSAISQQTHSLFQQTKEPETPTYVFRYSQYANRQKKLRKPTFTLNSRLTQENVNEALEEQLTKEQDQINIQKQLELYFSAQKTYKDEQYYNLYRNLLSQIYVGQDIMKELEDAYEFNYVPFYFVLESFRNTPNVEEELQDALKQFRELKTKIKNLINFESPICQDKLTKYKGFLTNIAYLYCQEIQIGERTFKILNHLFLRQEINVIAAYELFCIDLNIDDFLENVKLIEQVHFFKHTIELSEFDQIDEDMDLINVIIYLLKSTDIASQNIQVIEQVVKYGDRDLLKIFNAFKQKKASDISVLLKQVMNFAEYRASQVQQIEENINNQKQREETQKKISFQIDVLYTIQPLLKEVKYIKIIEDLVYEQHKITQSAFEVYDFSKDKQDFVETISLIYQAYYTRQLKDTVKMHLFDLKQPKEKITLMMDLIKNKDVHILSAWELYLKLNDLSDFKDTVSIILKKHFKI